MLVMYPYREIFEAIEHSLMKSSSLPENQFRQELDSFKHLEGYRFSDSEYFIKLVLAVFYAGIKAETINTRLDTIRGYLGDYKVVAGYEYENIRVMLSDPNMLRSERKVKGCVSNAVTFKGI